MDYSSTIDIMKEQLRDFVKDLVLDDGQPSKIGTIISHCFLMIGILACCEMAFFVLLYYFGDQWCSDHSHTQLYSWYLALHR